MQITSTKTIQSISVGLKLKHIESNKNVKENELPIVLSQGEQETLAWVLFKYYTLENALQSSNLIILDDPIASFDEFKRFSVINGIQKLLKKNPNNNILVLTHNKTMVSNFSKSFPQNIYLLKSNSLEKVDIDNVVVNEYRDNIKKIFKINEKGIKDKNILEFLIRSRNLLETFNRIENHFTEDVKNAHVNLSKLLHMNTTRLYVKTLRTLKNIFKVHKKQFTFNFDKSINIKQIFVYDLAFYNPTNLFSCRILLESFLRDKISKNSYKTLLEGKKTIGNIFDLAKKQKKLSNKEVKQISAIIPILNIVSHSDGVYGLSINDLEDSHLNLVKSVIQELIY